MRGSSTQKNKHFPRKVRPRRLRRRNQIRQKRMSILRARSKQRTRPRPGVNGQRSKRLKSIYTGNRNFSLWVAHESPMSRAPNKSSPKFGTKLSDSSTGPQFRSQQIQNRRDDEHDPVHFKLPPRRVREDPENGDDGESGHDLHAGKIEGRTVGPHVALHQYPTSRAAEKIH